MADDTTPGFTNTDLKTIEELAFRLKAADKSAQSINTQLERFIADNYRASQEADKKLSEQNSLLKEQQKTLQPPKKEETKPAQPINVTKEEDVFFEEPVAPITEPAPEPIIPLAATPVLPPPVLTPTVQEIPETSIPKSEPVQNKAAIDNLASSVTNVENNSYSVMPTTVEKVEKIIEKENKTEPKIVEAPEPAPQIIEKTIPITNTITKVEKTTEPISTEAKSTPPVIVEKPVEIEKSQPLPLPIKQENQQLPVVMPPSPSPVVNVNVTEATPSVSSPVPEANIPPIATQPSLPVNEVVTEPPQPQINIPEISAPMPPPPTIPEFTAAATPPAAEIPPVITEPETKKPDVGLNLADESLVGLNKGLEKIATILNQNQSKLIASIEALNNSVGEILKMLPSLQTGPSESQGQPSRSKKHNIDSSSMISNYRQGLGLTTRGFTNNTVFPGGNSIS